MCAESKTRCINDSRWHNKTNTQTVRPCQTELQKTYFISKLQIKKKKCCVSFHNRCYFHVIEVLTYSGWIRFLVCVCVCSRTKKLNSLGCLMRSAALNCFSGVSWQEDSLLCGSLRATLQTSTGKYFHCVGRRGARRKRKGCLHSRWVIMTACLLFFLRFREDLTKQMSSLTGLKSFSKPE